MKAAEENEALLYRPNVAGILQKPDGLILVANRRGLRNSWQFPQGGVDDGEDIVDALHREVEEELCIGPDHYEIMERKDGYRYVFPNGRVKERKYRGQEQSYFLCRFTGDENAIDVKAASHPEFDDHRWIKPRKFRMKWMAPFKREVYRQVFRDFFEVELED